jgi:hypothetical protein
MEEAQRVQGLRASMADQERADQRFQMDSAENTRRTGIQDQEMNWKRQDRATAEQDRTRKIGMEDENRGWLRKQQEDAMIDRNRKLKQEGFLDIIKAAKEGLPKDQVLKSKAVLGGEMPIKDFALTPDGSLQIISATGETATMDAETVDDLYRSSYGLSPVRRSETGPVGSYGTFMGLKDMGEFYDLTEASDMAPEGITTEQKSAIKDGLSKGMSYRQIADGVGLKPAGYGQLEKAQQEYMAAKTALDGAVVSSTKSGFLKSKKVSAGEERRIGVLRDTLEAKKNNFMRIKQEVEGRIQKAGTVGLRGPVASGGGLRAQGAAPAEGQVTMQPQSEATQSGDLNGDGKVDEADRLYGLAKRIVELYDSGDPNVTSQLEQKYGPTRLQEYRALVGAVDKSIQKRAQEAVAASGR